MRCAMRDARRDVRREVENGEVSRNDALSRGFRVSQQLRVAYGPVVRLMPCHQG